MPRLAMDLPNNMYRVLCAAILFTVVSSASISIADPHIVGGVITSIEQHPYQAALLYYDSHNCGASVLGPKYIVTAAHCFSIKSSPSDFTVRIGSNNKHYSGKLFTLLSFYRHPKYVFGNFDHDVGVAVLKEAIKFGPTVQPIPLVPINEEPKEGDVVTVSGWGWLSQNEERTSVLHAVTIPIVSRGKCREPNATKITPNMICAGSYGKTVYKGDSGGPLVNKKKQLVGVVSFSSASKLLSVPGVYTNIASQVIHDFITKHAPENAGHKNQ